MTDPGARLAALLADRYRIERELGAGGMATVYLAQDLKHDRRVAVKVLRPELAAVIGADRFLHEITVTANLSHPHILQLYDSGSADGLLYYVMPFVEGESLRDKLVREKQLSLEQVIEITRAVAGALDFAHRRGVIHRDIKPENILLVDDQPVVADFGIALAVSAAGGTRLTETGLSLGTPHYMSPEQAMGDRNVGARSDVYALGCVVYEMLVGEPPYTGPTAQAIIAKVITERPPPITLHRETVPPHVEAAVHRALSKVPADRFASAHEFAEALGRVFTVAPTPGPGAVDRAIRRLADVLRRPAAAWGTAGVLALAALALWLSRPGEPSAAAGQVVRFTIRLPQEQWLSFITPRISADGRVLVLPVHQGRETQLVVRALDESAPRRVTGLPWGDGGRPAVSPDGAWVTYSGSGKLWKVATTGEGAPIELAESRWGGADWTSDGEIVYTRTYQSGLWRVSADGGDVAQLSAPDSARGELGHWWPQVLPDGKGILFTAFSTPVEHANVEVLLPKSGERRILVQGAVFGRHVPTGHLLYVRGGTMLAVPFDLDRLEVSGRAVPVLDDVAFYPTDGVAGFDVSPGGTLVYVKASVWDSRQRLVWVDRAGQETPVLDRFGAFADPRLSPDGRLLGVTLSEGSRDIWIYEFARGVFTRLTRHGASAFNPVWTPDGRRVIYSGETPQFDLFWRAADGSTPVETLLTTPNDKVARSVTPDGKYLLYNENAPTSDIWMLALDGSRERHRLTDTPYDEVGPAVSPDGRWLAYVSDESGKGELYVMPFPEGGRRIQVSIDGGGLAVWARSGREILYRDGDRMLSARFDPRSGQVERPVEIFVRPYARSFASANFDIWPDGQRLLMVRTPPELLPREVEVVVNWFDELKRRMAEAQ